MDASAGVTQEKVYAGFLHLPSAVLALIFIARRVQPLPSLVDSEVKFCVLSRSTIGGVENVANLSMFWEGTA